MLASLSRAKKENASLAAYDVQKDWILFMAGDALTVAVYGVAYESWMTSYYKLTGKDKLEIDFGF